jgi:hypothetical protein
VKENEVETDVGDITSKFFHSTSSNSSRMKSRWLQLLDSGVVIESKNLIQADRSADFVCVDNRDSSDFRNASKY